MQYLESLPFKTGILAYKDIFRKDGTISLLYEAIKNSRNDLSEHFTKDLINQTICETQLKQNKFSKEKLGILTNQAAHQGVVAYISPIQYADLEETLESIKDKQENALIIMLDGVQDPHNLGAIIRSAKCAGADAVIIPKRNSSLVTSTVEKCSAGAVSLIPIIQVTNLNNAIDLLKEYGFWIYAAEANGEQYHHKVKYNTNTVFVMGGENQGVSKLTTKKCDMTIKINMKGEFNSLNVSNAASILMFEFLRQQEV